MRTFTYKVYSDLIVSATFFFCAGGSIEPVRSIFFIFAGAAVGSAVMTISQDINYVRARAYHQKMMGELNKRLESMQAEAEGMLAGFDDTKNELKKETIQ